MGMFGNEFFLKNSINLTYDGATKQSEWKKRKLTLHNLKESNLLTAECCNIDFNTPEETGAMVTHGPLLTVGKDRKK